MDEADPCPIKRVLCKIIGLRLSRLQVFAFLVRFVLRWLCLISLVFETRRAENCFQAISENFVFYEVDSGFARAI